MRPDLYPAAIFVGVRTVAAIVGGYLLTAGIVAVSVIVLPAFAILSRGEAVVLTSMLAYLFYLAVAIWVFAERRLMRLCIVLVGSNVVVWGMATTIPQLEI